MKYNRNKGRFRRTSDAKQKGNKSQRIHRANRWVAVVIAALSMCLFLTACSAVSEESMEQVKGKVIGSTYENEYFGFQIDLDDSWTFINDADLAEVNGLDEDYSVSDVSRRARKGQAFTIMEAGDEDQHEHMTVMAKYENHLFGISEDSLIKNDIDTMTSVWQKEYGTDDLVTGQSTVQIESKEYPCIIARGTTTATDSSGHEADAVMYIRRMYIIKDNAYAAIEAASTTEDHTKELLETITIND